MAQFHVRNQTELKSALSKVKGGDDILLAPGAKFDKIELYKKSFASDVTIASADPNKPAKVLALNLNGVSNVTIEDVVFDSLGKTSRPFVIDNSKGVTIRDSVFDGHKDSAGYGRDLGLQVKRSEDVTLEGNLVKTFNNGFGFSDSKNLVVTGNELVDIRNDGMTLAGIQNILIEGNELHGFRSPSSLRHIDAIQVWTTNSTASEKIMIVNNVFEGGAHRQTIFIGNEAARSTKAAAAHKDILIAGNEIKGMHTHGISVEHVNGVVIHDNRLAPAHGAPDKVASGTVPLINVTHSSANVTITGNTVAAVQKEVRGSWTIEDNTLTTSKSFWFWAGSSSVPRINDGPSTTYLAWVAETDSENFRFATVEAVEADGASADFALYAQPLAAAPAVEPSGTADTLVLAADEPALLTADTFDLG